MTCLQKKTMEARYNRPSKRRTVKLPPPMDSKSFPTSRFRSHRDTQGAASANRVSRQQSGVRKFRQPAPSPGPCGRDHWRRMKLRPLSSASPPTIRMFMWVVLFPIFCCTQKCQKSWYFYRRESSVNLQAPERFETDSLTYARKPADRLVTSAVRSGGNINHSRSYCRT